MDLCFSTETNLYEICILLWLHEKVTRLCDEAHLCISKDLHATEYKWLDSRLSFCLNSYAALGRLVAGFPPPRPLFELRSGHVGFVVDKVAWGRFSSSASISPANHSNDCSTLIIIHHPGLVQKAKLYPERNQDCDHPWWCLLSMYM
jgi:hypothetical protein